MSDLENELLGLAEDDPTRHSKRRHTSGDRDRSKRKSKAFIEEDSDDGEADMDIDSDSDDDGPAASSSRARGPVKNPYPLEGKYVDEADREALENMPEIQRENILASRLEEMQKFKDSQALDAMFKGIGGDEDDDEDEGRARKKRKHTSVTKEASKALNVLKDKRKAKDERMQRRAARRSTRRSASVSDASTEDGEIHSHSRPYRHSPEYSPERSPTPKRDTRPQISQEDEMDRRAPDRQELNSARVSRYELVDMMHKDRFEETIVGAYVRLMAPEPDEYGRPKYRIHKIAEVDTSGSFGYYSIEYKGRNVRDNRALLCKYGSLSRLWRMADVSNSDFQDAEFDRFERTNNADGVKPPKRSVLKKKHDEIKALRERPMTNAEIDRRVDSRKAQENTYNRGTQLKIHQLMNTRDLAVRRNDNAMVEKLNGEIIKLGGDPATGKIVGEEEGEDEYDLKIQRINENNKKKTKESQMRAHAAAVARKKAEEAIVKAKLAAASSTDSVAGVTVPEAPPVSGLKKGETPQQYVARTVQLDLDLGDF
ncbi:hypothetical protein IAT38_003299 [Cryptococcus sp. DSM 104549]